MMTFQINIVKTAIRKSLNRNLSWISPSILSLILNDAVQYLEESVTILPTQEEYGHGPSAFGGDCPPDSECPSSPETEILSAPSTQEEYDCPPDSWEDMGCPSSPETGPCPSAFGGDCPPDSGCPSSPQDGDDSLYAQLEGSLDSSLSGDGPSGQASALNCSLGWSPSLNQQDGDDNLYSQLEGSLDDSDVSVSDRELDRELKEVGEKWQAYVNGESPPPSRNRFHLYSTPRKEKISTSAVSAAQKEKKDNELLRLLQCQS